MREVKKPATVIKNFSPKAVMHNGDSKYGFSVLVKDRKSQFEAWFDVWIEEKFHDVGVDWNQYIFFDYDERDMFNKAVMQSSRVFDLADSCAVEYLASKGLIVQNEKGEWSYGKEESK